VLLGGAQLADRFGQRDQPQNECEVREGPVS
jgi:hypothetical protein